MRRFRKCLKRPIWLDHGAAKVYLALLGGVVGKERPPFILWATFLIAILTKTTSERLKGKNLKRRWRRSRISTTLDCGLVV